jgi:hypothetical protein
MTTITARYSRRHRLDRAAVRVGTVLVAWGSRAEVRAERRAADRATNSPYARHQDDAERHSTRAAYVESARDSAAYARHQLLP